jgi:hypothetical protein
LIAAPRNLGSIMNALEGIVVQGLIGIVDDLVCPENPTEPHVQQVSQVIWR